VASREVKEAEGIGIKKSKWELHEWMYYLHNGDMMDVRERVAYSEEVHRNTKHLGQQWKAKAVGANALGVRAWEISPPATALLSQLSSKYRGKGPQ